MFDWKNLIKVCYIQSNKSNLNENCIHVDFNKLVFSMVKKLSIN